MQDELSVSFLSVNFLFKSQRHLGGLIPSTLASGGHKRVFWGMYSRGRNDEEKNVIFFSSPFWPLERARLAKYFHEKVSIEYTTQFIDATDSSTVKTDREEKI